MHIHVEGFDFDKKDGDGWRSTLNRIKEKAPSGATLCSCLVYKNGQFHGSIKMRSLHGAFATHAQGEDCREVQDKMFKRIMEQISNWQKIRFELDNIAEGKCYLHRWMKKSEIEHLKQQCRWEKCPIELV